MIFTVLGSGTAAPDPERGSAGFLVQVGGRAWLVDGGSGTLQRCTRAGVDPCALDGGFYSHRHPDHTGDLVPLLFALRVARREVPYPIWAGEGFHPFLQALEGAYGHWIQPPGGVVVEELPLHAPHVIALGELVVRTAPANHSAGALHLRFEADGASVVFSGDTGPSEALVTLATGADLLVCECAGSDDRPLDGHMTPSAVADLVARAWPREVWLTHLSERVDPARAVETVAATGVPTRRVRDLERVVLSRG